MPASRSSRSPHRSGSPQRQRSSPGHRPAGSPYRYAHPDDLLSEARKHAEPPLLVALDSITDPRNLGAVVRSVAAFGGHGVVIPERRSASVSAVAWRTSAGAAARLPIARATNLTRTLKDWASKGVQVVGLDAEGDTTLDVSTAVPL